MTDRYFQELQNKSLGLAPAKEEKPKVRISIHSVKRMAEERLYAKKKKEYLLKV